MSIHSLREQRDEYRELLRLMRADRDSILVSLQESTVLSYKDRSALERWHPKDLQ